MAPNAIPKPLPLPLSTNNMIAINSWANQNLTPTQLPTSSTSPNISLIKQSDIDCIVSLRFITPPLVLAIILI